MIRRRRRIGYVATMSVALLALLVYVGLVLVLLCISLFEAITYSVFSMVAARNLHNRMFNIVLRAPMSFFERRPVGEVLFVCLFVFGGGGEPSASSYKV